MGVATMLLFHVLINVGMVVGNMPVTGIPLPLMSYGGSNLFSIFIMLGLGEQCPAPAVFELSAQPARGVVRG